MDITNDDDLEVAAVLAKGLGQELGSVGVPKLSGSVTSGRQSGQSPSRSATLLTNNSRGNTATLTPSQADRAGIHQVAARGELLLLQQFMEESHVNEPDEHHLTPLMWASMYGQSEVVTYLLECGAESNMTDHRGVTALMMACYHGNVNVVKVLMEKARVDVDMVDEDGNTALLYSVLGDQAECTVTLLAAGADLTARNNDGLCAMDGAIKLRHKQVQKAIEQYLLNALRGS